MKNIKNHGMSPKIIIDTNGLMIPGQFRIDIFLELSNLGFNSYFVASASVKELQKLSTDRGKNGMAAKIGLLLLDRCVVIEKNGFADDVIIDIALDINAAVLTNDAKLKKRLSTKGITIVYLRERTRLSF